MWVDMCEVDRYTRAQTEVVFWVLCKYFLNMKMLLDMCHSCIMDFVKRTGKSLLKIKCLLTILYSCYIFDHGPQAFKIISTGRIGRLGNTFSHQFVITKTCCKSRSNLFISFYF